MKQLALFSLVIAIAFSVFSCQETASKNTKTENTFEKKEIILDTSSLILPIDIDISSFEHLINEQMDSIGWLVEETGLEINKNLSIAYRVKKDGKAQLYPQNGNIQLKVPLFVDISPKITSSLSLGLGRNMKMQSKLMLDAEITSSIQEDYDLKADVNSKFTVIESPSLNLLGFDINFGKQITENLSANSDEINKQLASQIKEAIHTKEIISTIWDELKEPYRVNEEPFDVFIDLAPTKVVLTDLMPSKPGTMRTILKLDGLMDIHTGKKPSSKSKQLPNAIIDNDLTDKKSHLKFPLKVNINSFTKYMNEEYEEFKIPLQGNDLILSNFKATTKNNATLKVLTDFTYGAIQGQLNLYGTPHFNQITQTLSLQKVKLKSKSNNQVVDQLFNTIQTNKKVKELLEKQMQFSLQDEISNLNFELTKQLKNTEFNEFSRLDGYIESIKINDVYLDENFFNLATEVLLKTNCTIDYNGNE